MNGKVTTRGNSDRLIWALFDFPAEVHGIPGRFVAGVHPGWPDDHLPDATCPCRPAVYWDSEAAPRPFYEHRRLTT